jgi:hypothetical protein
MPECYLSAKRARTTSIGRHWLPTRSMNIRWLSGSGKQHRPEQLRNRIRAEGITHVVLNTGEFRRVHDLYKVLDFSGPEERILDLRLKELPRLLTLLFVKHNVYVFQVPSGG